MASSPLSEASETPARAPAEPERAAGEANAPAAGADAEGPARAREARGVEGLLRALGPRLRRGVEHDAAATPPELRRPTGLEALDRLLGGGFPAGRLCELAGPASCGRTSLALALLARTTAAGGLAAVIDAADAFDPPSARAAGAALERVLWVRAPGEREALRAAEHVLGAGGFALAVVDLAALPRRRERTERRRPRTSRKGERPEREAAIPPAAWPRLRRAAAASEAAVVLLAEERRAGSFSDLALALESPEARFDEAGGAPPLLEALEARVRVVRSRLGPPEGAARVRWRSADVA